LRQLFQHLGIDRAHFAGRMPERLERSRHRLPRDGRLAHAPRSGDSRSPEHRTPCLIEETELQPGERILEVGCGTGVLDRWLARRTDGKNPIVGVDINRYLLRDAAALTRKDGLEATIAFREGNAEALPFPDGSFDVSIAVT